MTDGHLETRASWQQPVVPEAGNRKETTMHPALHRELMQARNRDLERSVAQRRLVAEAETARRARQDDTDVVPTRRRALRLVLRLLPA